MRGLILVSGMLALVFAASMVGTRPRPFLDVDWAWTAATIVVVGALYLASASAYHRVVAFGFVGAALIIPCSATWGSADAALATGELGFVILGIIFAAFLLRLREAAVAIVCGLGLAVGSLFAYPGIPVAIAFYEMGVFVFVGALSIAAAWFRQEWARRLQETSRELRSTEQRNQLVMDSALDAIITLDSTRRVTHWNPRAHALFGYPPIEVLGKRVEGLLELQPAADGSGTTHRGLDFDLPPPNRPVEMRATTKDGRQIAVEFSVSVIESDGTTIYGLFAHDLQARKELEAQLRVRDRLAAVGTLVAGVAHEINNPLAYLSANLELLQAQGVARGESVVAIREATARIRTIVSDLRTFAAPSEHARPVATDVRQVVESALRMASGELRERAQVQANLEDVPLITADPARLGQLVLNLLVNAAQSIPEGAATDNVVSIDLRHLGATLSLEIADSGAGIDPEIRDRIFDPFSTTKSGEGMGLGLYICNQIARSLGGTIRFDANEPRGTRAVVELPVAACVAPRVVEETAWRHSIVTTPGLAVLVIDDEPELLRVLAEVLEAYDVTTAGPEEAKSAEFELFDAVVCDLMMPGVNGKALFDAARAQDKGLEERFIFMTGGAFPLWAQKFVESVPNRCLAKPFSTQDLVAAIEEVFVQVSEREDVSQDLPVPTAKSATPRVARDRANVR